MTDNEAGGQYFFDAENDLFWTWDTPALISRKFDDIVRKYKLGGVMAWSLGEDSFDWSHIKAMADELEKGGYGSGEPSAQPKGSDSPPLEQGPVGPQTPTVTTAPTPSASFNVVWVDGTSEGPAGDHATQPGSPDSFVANKQDEQVSPPQQNTPLPIQPPSTRTRKPRPRTRPRPRPRPRPSPRPIRRPRPSQRKPTPHLPAQPINTAILASPAQTASSVLPSQSPDALPFSPEFLAALGGERGAPRVTPAPRGRVDVNRKAARAPRRRRGKGKGKGRKMRV